jgi:hypothetical protein
MQREVSLDTNETAFESDSGILDLSRLHPLPLELHAVCQSEANEEVNAHWRERSSVAG